MVTPSIYITTPVKVNLRPSVAHFNLATEAFRTGSSSEHGKCPIRNQLAALTPLPEVLCGFRQMPHANAGIVSHIIPRPLPCTFFSVYSVIVIPFN